MPGFGWERKKARNPNSRKVYGIEALVSTLGERELTEKMLRDLTIESDYFQLKVLRKREAIYELKQKITFKRKY